MSERPKLRRPWDQDVADCMWLARLTDKVRLHLTGNLNEDFEPFFGHRLATDGAFIDFFEIELKDLIAVVQSEPTNDQAVTTWFLANTTAAPTLIRVSSAFLAESLGTKVISMKCLIPYECCFLS